MDPRFLDLDASCRWVVSFTSRPLYLWERAPGTHWLGGWVGPRVSLDNVKKGKFFTLPVLELRSLGWLTRSQSLYRLRYPGSQHQVTPYRKHTELSRQILLWFLENRLQICKRIPITKIYFFNKLISVLYSRNAQAMVLFSIGECVRPFNILILMVLRSTISVFWRCEFLLCNPVGNCLFLSVQN
jgi:hypothetical protein